MNKSYVYLVESGGSYKIGKSDSPKLRLASLQVSHTKPLKLLYLLEYTSSELATIAEKELHTIFKSKNIRGEWFLLESNDILVFKTFGTCITLHRSQFEYWAIGIDFIDVVTRISNNERTVIKFIKDSITWDKELHSFNYIATLAPDSAFFDPAAQGSIKYETFLKGFNLLCKEDLVRRVRRHQYMFNPDFFIPSGEQVAYFERIWAESKPCK